MHACCARPAEQPSIAGMGFVSGDWLPSEALHALVIFLSMMTKGSHLNSGPALFSARHVLEEDLCKITMFSKRVLAFDLQFCMQESCTSICSIRHSAGPKLVYEIPSYWPGPSYSHATKVPAEHCSSTGRPSALLLLSYP